MRLAFCAALLICALPATAQTIQGNSDTISLGQSDVTRQTRVRVNAAPAAILRGLDKISGQSVDLPAAANTLTEFGALEINMLECRYPEGNPNGDAYVRLIIHDKAVSDPVFDGWMIASSPALNALDHARYDIWVIRCKLDDRTPAVVAGESSPRPLMRPEGLGGN